MPAETTFNEELTEFTIADETAEETFVVVRSFSLSGTHGEYGKVNISFSTMSLFLLAELFPEDAREVARALIDHADRADTLTNMEDDNHAS